MGGPRGCEVDPILGGKENESDVQMPVGPAGGGGCRRCPVLFRRRAPRATPNRPPPRQGLTSPRLYIFDCGHLRVGDPGRFSLTMDEVSTLDLSVPCYLIEHAQGSLLWDAGLSDALAGQDASPQSSGSVATVTNTLRAQLAELGYEPADVTYLAMSHLHYDHAGNANDFAASTWLVQRPEHEAAFSDDPAAYRFDPQYYGALETAETLILDGDHDVFGDGSVVIKSAPGHTPATRCSSSTSPSTAPSFSAATSTTSPRAGP